MTNAPAIVSAIDDSEGSSAVAEAYGPVIAGEVLLGSVSAGTVCTGGRAVVLAGPRS